MDAAHPFVQSLVVPFAVALVSLWGLRALGGARLAPAAAGVGLLAGLSLMPGFGATVAAPEKVPWAAAAALAAALLLGWRRREPPRALSLLVSAALLAGLGLWLGGMSMAVLAAAALGWLVTVAVPLAGASSSAPALTPASPPVSTPASSSAGMHPASLPAVQAVAAAGLAGVAIQAGSALLAQIAAAIAAASAAVVLGNWPRSRARFGPVSLLAIGVPTALLALLLWRLTDVRLAALLALAATCLVQTEAARLALPERWRRDWLEPLAAALLAAVPAVIAIVLAASGDGGGGAYLR